MTDDLLLKYLLLKYAEIYLLTEPSNLFPRFAKSAIAP